MPTEPMHVTAASIYRPDPAAPAKRWIGPPIAESAQVAIYDEQPNLSQPFQFANGSTIADFVVGGAYWLLGVTDDGRRVWKVRLLEVRPAGRDVMLVGRAS